MKILKILWTAISGLLQSAVLVLLLNSVATPFEKIVIALLALIFVSISNATNGTVLLLAGILRKVDSAEAEDCDELIEKGGISLLIRSGTDGITTLIAIGQLVKIILNK